MTIVALAIETTHSLTNSIVVASSTHEAVEKLIGTLELFEEEKIVMIVADVLIEGENMRSVAEDWAVCVERLFENAVPELFIDGYFEDAE